MSREITADQLWAITTRESRLFTMDFTQLLSTGETINGVSGTSGGVTLGVTVDAVITAGTPAVNIATIEDDRGDTIAIGKAIQVRLSAASAAVGEVYDVLFTCVTTANNRIEQIARLQVL
jgi:hypothetical protein